MLFFSPQSLIVLWHARQRSAAWSFGVTLSADFVRVDSDAMRCSKVDVVSEVDTLRGSGALGDAPETASKLSKPRRELYDTKRQCKGSGPLPRTIILFSFRLFFRHTSVIVRLNGNS